MFLLMTRNVSSFVHVQYLYLSLANCKLVRVTVNRQVAFRLSAIKPQLSSKFLILFHVFIEKSLQISKYCLNYPYLIQNIVKL